MTKSAGKKSLNQQRTGFQKFLRWAAIIVALLVFFSLVFAFMWSLVPQPARQHFRRAVAAKLGRLQGSQGANQVLPNLARVIQNSKQVAEALQKKTKGLVEPGTNVVMVVVDTERADHLGTYGERLATSPFVDAIAKDGVVFTRMYSVAPWTVPSMNSLMTGLYPSQHGVESGGVTVVGGQRRVSGQPPLSEDAVTLAEVFQENGYSTFGVNTNHHLNAKYGFSQGFDRFVGDDFLFLPYPNMMAESMVEEIGNSAKHFLWLHYFDPHFPYRPIAPWFGEWNSSKYGDYAEFSKDLIIDYFRKDQELEPDEPIIPEYMHFLYMLIAPVAKSHAAINYALEYLGEDPQSDFVTFLQTAYKSEIRYVDTAIEDAFQTLGIDDQTLVVITADHGEEMYDHGAFGHRHTLYQELLHVPLIFRLPGKKHAGMVIDVPVSTVDVMPTLLDLVGLPIPKGLPGMSLAPLMEGGTLAPRPLWAEVQNRFGKSSTLIEYPWKLIYSFKTEKVELYNLHEDPKERVDMATADGARAQSMKKRLLEWTEGKGRLFKETEATPLSPEEIQRLKEMGYMQ